MSAADIAVIADTCAVDSTAIDTCADTSAADSTAIDTWLEDVPVALLSDKVDLGLLDFYSGYSGEVNIPEFVTYEGNTYKVTSIGESAFWGCSGLTSVTIPNSVTSIGERAF